MADEVDMNKFINDQWEKIEMQKNQYNQLVGILSEHTVQTEPCELNVETDYTGTASRNLNGQRYVSNEIPIKSTNNRNASQFMLSDYSQNSESHSTRQKFVPGLGLVQGNDECYEKLLKETYRRQLDDQVKKNKKFKEQKKVDEDRVDEELKITNGSHCSLESLSDKAKSEDNLFFFHKSRDEDLPQRSKRGMGPNSDKNSTSGSKCGTPEAHKCSSRCETVCSFLAHGGELCRVDQHDLQLCHRLNQELYRLDLDKQVEEKKKSVADDKERERKEDEKVNEYNAKQTVSCHSDKSIGRVNY